MVDETKLVTALLLTTFPKRRAMLHDALASFATQDYPDMELVVVNDGYPVRSRCARVRVVNVEDPLGLSLGAKRNRGLAEANGAYIAVWDDDDFSLPGRTRGMVAELEHRGAAFVYSRSMFLAHKDLRVEALIRRSGLQTAVFCRDRAIAVGGYGDRNYCEDQVLQRRLRAVDRPSVVPLYRRDYIHRRHAANVSRVLRGETLAVQLEKQLRCSAQEIAGVNAKVAELRQAAGHVTDWLEAAE